MTKTDLVNAMAEKAGLTKADTARALDAMIESIEEGLKKVGKVAITGFCTFTARKKEAKTARNPRTGKTVQVPAKTVLTIKAGSKLKEALN